MKTDFKKPLMKRKTDFSGKGLRPSSLDPQKATAAANPPTTLNARLLLLRSDKSRILGCALGDYVGVAPSS